MKLFVDVATQIEVSIILVTEDTATQELAFSITFANDTTQINIVSSLMEKDAITQEPTSPDIITKAAI